MNFWDSFSVESLQSPWMIGSIKEEKSIPEPRTKKVFIVKNETTDSQFEMMSKMILALKYKAEDVTILERSDYNLDFLKDWKDAKKILLFGQGFTNQMGSFINLYGSQLMSTHGLSDLESDVELKKQTWQHLKKFEKLK